MPGDDDPSAEFVPSLPPSPFSGDVERYDIDNNEWSTLRSMSEGKGNFFIGEVNGRIYVMGGLLNNSLNISSKTEEYNIDSNVWEDQTIMSTPRFGGMSVTIGNDIYTIGGLFQDSTNGGGLSVSNTVEVYHTDTNTWEDMESMPIISPGEFSEEKLGVAFGAAQHVVIDSENYIYIIGGIQRVISTSNNFSIEAYSERILRYHVETGIWSKSGILRSRELSTYQRISPLTLVYDDKITVFNGAIESGNNFIYPVDNFSIDIESDFTNTVTDGEWINFGGNLLNGFPSAKFQSAMVRCNYNPSVADIAEYYIMGGWDSNSMGLDILENLSATSTGFVYTNSYDANVSVILSSLLTGRHGASALYSDSDGSPYIYLIGGYTIARTSEFIDITFDI